MIRCKSVRPQELHSQGVGQLTCVSRSDMRAHFIQGHPHNDTKRRQLGRAKFFDRGRGVKCSRGSRAAPQATQAGRRSTRITNSSNSRDSTQRLRPQCPQTYHAECCLSTPPELRLPTRAAIRAGRRSQGGLYGRSLRQRSGGPGPTDEHVARTPGLAQQPADAAASRARWPAAAEPPRGVGAQHTSGLTTPSPCSHA
jgi:hypothetical protein